MKSLIHIVVPAQDVADLCRKVSDDSNCVVALQKHSDDASPLTQEIYNQYYLEDSMADLLPCKQSLLYSIR